MTTKNLALNEFSSCQPFFGNFEYVALEHVPTKMTQPTFALPVSAAHCDLFVASVAFSRRSRIRHAADLH